MPRRAPRRRDEPADSPADAAPLNQIELELDAWERYVRDFTRVYALDEGQRQAAESILFEMQARARDHYRRHRR